MRTPDATLVFVEVRFRGNNTHGGALASVDSHKQGRLIQAARHYLASNPALSQSPCRFDVVAIEPSGTDQQTIEWIQNAFLAE